MQPHEGAHFHGMWLSLVERSVRDGEVIGSTPIIPTATQRDTTPARVPRG